MMQFLYIYWNRGKNVKYDSIQLFFSLVYESKIIVFESLCVEKE